MKKLILILAVLTMVSCSGKRKISKETHYINVELEVMSKDVYTVSHGKSNSADKSILVRVVGDTTQYTELSGYYYDGSNEPFRITDSLYYVAKPGHKLHFDFIRKNRFWTNTTK